MRSPRSIAPATLAFAVCCCASAIASAAERAEPSVAPLSYTLETFVEGMPFHGPNGLTFDAEGRLYVGSVVGQTTFRVDPENGKVTVAVPSPDGCADDMEFGPDGRLYWTQQLGRRVVAAVPGGPIQVLADGMNGINAIAWNAQGRLFVSEVFDGDALYEIDPKGVEKPRQILKDIGGLNGFDFGADGKLYGPLWEKKTVVRIDVDSGRLDTIATGFAVAAAANFDSKGRLFVLDNGRGEVVRVDVATGTRTVVATLQPGLDNLAFDPRDRLFVTSMANNGVYHVDPDTGAVRTVVEGRLALPADLDLVEEADGREILHVADTFAYRTVDLGSGEIATLGRLREEGLVNPTHVTVGDTLTLVTFFLRGEAQLLKRGTGHVVATLELTRPGAALALPGDRFLVTDMKNGTLIELDAAEVADSKVESARRIVATDLGMPADVAWAGKDRVYVTDAAGGRLLDVDLASGRARAIATGLAQPEGIDTAPDGSVIVAEAGAHRISRVDPGRGKREVIADAVAIGIPAPPGLPAIFLPTGVVVSKTGAIYFSSDVDGGIYRLVPSSGDANR